MGNAWAVCRWSNPTRPVSSSQQMKPLQATSLPSWRETEQITHDVKQLAREPKIIPIKTEYKCFDTLSLPFHESWGRALAHSQFSALSLPGTRPLTCEGGKVLRTEKKKPKSRKRFCSPTSLASSLGAKQRRKVEKRAETQICAHLYTSLVPQAVNGELKGYFLAYFSDLLRVCSLFAHRGFFATFR